MPFDKIGNCGTERLLLVRSNPNQIPGCNLVKMLLRTMTAREYVGEKCELTNQDSVYITYMRKQRLFRL